MDGQTPPGMLAAALAADAARPFITFYDAGYPDAGRIELSVATFDNWVAKTANFLVDGLAAEPGQRVVLLLPLHWQTAAWLFACWSAGLVACPVRADDPPGDLVPGADIVAAGPDHLDVASAAGAPETVGVSLHPLGAPLSVLPGAAGDLPLAVVDYAAEVRGYGDRFVPYQPVDPSAPALLIGGQQLSGADLAGRARAAAARWELTPADRVLSTAELDTTGGLLASLLAPLAAGASVVLCGTPPPADELARRVATERITAVAGISVSGPGCRNLHIASDPQ